MYKTGVYDISIEEYHSCEGISRSGLTEMLKSPLHYLYKLTNTEIKEPVPIIKKINALEYGNALHTYVLERETFDDRYVVMPKVNRATKAGKLAYADCLDRSGLKAIICEEAYDEIVKMGQSIDCHMHASRMIEDGLYEKSIFWTDPDSGLLCKVRPDIWQSNFIGDLKTTVSGTMRDFTRSVYAYGYHIQAGMIHEALKHVQGETTKCFIYIVIEKEPPYAVVVYQLDELAVDFGVNLFKELLLKVKKCMDENHWPSYPSGIIPVPNWAFNQ